MIRVPAITSAFQAADKCSNREEICLFIYLFIASPTGDSQDLLRYISVRNIEKFVSSGFVFALKKGSSVGLVEE